jgi:hypothetical protein
MDNLVVSPALAAGGVGRGAWKNTSQMGRKKTVTVTGAFSGSLTVEVGNNSLGGLNWAPLHSWSGPGTKSFEVACEAMRVYSNIPTTGTDPPVSPTVDIASNDDGVQASAIPAPAGDGVGASINVELYGLFKSFVLSGTWDGTCTIEVSHDDTDWTPVRSFTGSGRLFSLELACRYLRLRRGGCSASPGTPVLYVAAVNDDEKLTNLFGDGSDGDVTLVANISLARDMYYNSLDMAGYDINLAGFRLFVRELLDARFLAPGGGSIITANGADGAAEVGGAGLVGVTVGSGADGGDGNAGAAGDAGSAIAGQGLGGDGGVGGTGNGGANAGGAAGAVTVLNTATETSPRSAPECFTGHTWAGATPSLINGGAGGSAGGGDAAANEGGGGGGGGGVAIVSAQTIRLGSNCGIQASGAGGGGGAVIVNYRTLVGTGTLSASGGDGGASGGGTGVAGADGEDGTVIENQI